MTTFTTEDRKKGADPYVIADLLEFNIDPAYLNPADGGVLIQAAYILRMQADRYLKYWKIKETQKDYIPYPATFLNQERWTDELDLEPNKKPELPWYSTEELTARKAQEVGCPAYAGEAWQQWRARISQKIKQIEEQI